MRPSIVVAGGLIGLCLAAHPVGALSIATWNVHNLSPTQPESHFDRVAGVITVALAAPDVVALQEVQDSDGAIDSAITDARVTLDQLLAALARAGHAEYWAIDVAPQDDSDGGEPGGNIRNAFLLRRDRVKLARVPDGDANPRRLAPDDPSFTDSRKPLVVELEVEGGRMIVVNLHLRARLARGGESVGGGDQRTRQARVVAAFVDTMRAAGEADGVDVIVLGDLNALSDEPPLAVLESAALFDVTRLIPQAVRFSTNFNGTPHLLDHVLVSAALRGRIEAVNIVPLTRQLQGVSDHAPIHARIGVSGLTPGATPAIGCSMNGTRPTVGDCIPWPACWLVAVAVFFRRRLWRPGPGPRATQSTRR